MVEPRIEYLAACLWREQAVDIGAPPSVAAARTPAAFADESEQLRRPFLKYAACAVRVLLNS